MLGFAGALVNLVIGLVRLRFAVLFFVFMLPFFPRSMAFPVGDGGLALTERRLAIVFLLTLFFILALTKGGALARIISIARTQAVFFSILLAMLTTKVVSTLINSGIGSLSYVLDEILSSIFLFIIVFFIINSRRDVRNAIMALIIGLLISGVLAVVEQIKGAPLLQGLVNVEVADAGRDLLEGYDRDGHYRSGALFDNPLLLAEFACLVFPFSLWGVTAFHGRSRLIALAGVLCVPLVLVLVYTRSGALVAAIGLLVFVYGYLWGRASDLTKFIMSIFLVAITFLSLYLAAMLVINPEILFSKKNDGGVSALERASQYFVVADAMTKSPLFGYGLTQNFAKDLDFLNHLDNYWLRLLLEGGLVAFVLFLFILFILVRKSIRIIRLGNSSEDRMFGVALLSFFVSFSVYKLFLSMPTNNVYLYIVSALLLWHAAHLGVNDQLESHKGF